MSKELASTEKRVQEIINKYPHTSSNNTEMIITYVEHFVRVKGKDITYMEGWMEAKDLLRSYGSKPESIIKTRRKLVKPTEKQKQKEEDHREYWN